MTTLRLAEGQSAVFGYGSLLSRASMEVTLGREYGGPFMVAALDGWRRAWNVQMPNRTFFERTPDGDFVPKHIIYLNIRRAIGDSVNGTLFVVEPDELIAFDRREWIYDRVDVTGVVQGVSVVGGRVFVYVAKPEWLVCADGCRDDAAVRQTYMQTVERGLSELGSKFRAQFERTTDPVPAWRLFNDQKAEGTHPLLAHAED